MEKPNHKIMMHKDKSNKRLISELNSYITCKLCKGYFIDATTIIECLHTFCRSCIVKYLKTNKYCPICDVQVHKTKPLLNIRHDKTLQDLVYKLVPRLYHNEAKRRKIFYDTNQTSKPSVSEENMASYYEYILSPDENINLTLNYDGCSTTPRYLRCSCSVSIAHLNKLIHAKYDLTNRHKVDMLYNHKVLNPAWSLMDVAYIYSWKKSQALDLTYKIYECRAKKPKLDSDDSTLAPSNNNNWKEVQLRISENGEMSITGIQDGSMMDLLEATENFKNEVVINESKKPEGLASSVDNETKTKPEGEEVAVKPTEIANGHKESLNSKPTTSSTDLTIKPKPQKVEVNNEKHPNMETTKIGINNNTRLTNSDTQNVLSVFPVSATASSCLLTSESTISIVSTLPKSVELSHKLNLNSELSVIPLSSSANCVSLSSCGTTTVYSTINRSMCSTKLDESSLRRTENKTCIDTNKDVPVSKPSNTLKRKCEESEKLSELPAKLPKPTILNHSIGLMNLSNNHPLKKHSKLNRNGERRHLDLSDKVPNLTVSHSTIAQKPSADSNNSKPIIINRSLQIVQRCSPSKAKQQQKNNNSVPCYAPKPANERNGDRQEISVTLCEKSPVVSKPQNTYQNTHHTPIITPAQLPHHQNLNSLQNKATDKPDKEPSSNDKESVQNSKSTPSSESAAAASTAGPTCTVTAKPKPATPMGYKTLRDPPKSWNSQINSQIAKVNQNAKAQQLANLAAGAAAQGRLSGDLKSVRPAKFFKGRNMPRYLGNPASGVKPMYQVHVSPEKDKTQDPQTAQKTTKSEKSEIKKHSIVKIDPKTLKPISEKAPETSNLSNISSLALAVSQAGQELRLTSSPSDLKINTSSVSIFNPLKLQQSSPKSDRRSPKSPHSPKVSRSNQNSTAATSTSCVTLTTSSSPCTLSPKQQRDKISLTTPPNPYIPNLGSPTLNPNQFLYPAGGFPSYDPRFMAACHSLWYTQRMAAAAAAGLVPPPLPHAFGGLNIGLSPPNNTTNQPSSPGISPKHSATKPTSQTRTNNSAPSKPSRKTKETTTSGKTDKSLESALEKLSKQVKEAKVAEEKHQKTISEKPQAPEESNKAESGLEVKDTAVNEVERKKNGEEQEEQRPVGGTVQKSPEISVSIDVPEAVVSPSAEARPKTPPPIADPSTPPAATAPSVDNPHPVESQAGPEVEKIEEHSQKEKSLEPAVTEEALPVEQDKNTPTEDQATVSELSKCQEDVSVSESNRESADILSVKEAAKLEKDVNTPVVQPENGDGLTSQNNTEDKEKSENLPVETSQSEGI